MPAVEAIGLGYLYQALVVRAGVILQRHMFVNKFLDW